MPGRSELHRERSLLVVTTHALLASLRIRLRRGSIRPDSSTEGCTNTKNTISQCKSCSSSNVIRLNAEVCLHFPGFEGLKKAPIFTFPEAVICSDCGFMQSELSAEELRLVRESAAEVKEKSL